MEFQPGNPAWPGLLLLKMDFNTWGSYGSQGLRQFCECTFIPERVSSLSIGVELLWSKQHSRSKHQFPLLEPHPHLAPLWPEPSWSPARCGFWDAPHETISCSLLGTLRTGETTNTSLGKDPEKIPSPAARGRRKREVTGLVWRQQIPSARDLTWSRIWEWLKAGGTGEVLEIFSKQLEGWYPKSHWEIETAGLQ